MLFVAGAMLAGLTFQTPPESSAISAQHNPHAGDPCTRIRYYRVSFTQDAAGVRAVFRFAGGEAVGTFPLSADDAQLAASLDAYVADVQLGSYEFSQDAHHGELACRLDRTFHFYCRKSKAVDQFCYIWVPRGRRPGAS